MITVRGDNELWRGGEKVGWVQGHEVFNREGKRVGSFSDHHVFNHEGRKLAYLEGDRIKAVNGEGQGIRIEDNHAHVVGGVLSDGDRAAVRILLGD